MRRFKITDKRAWRDENNQIQFETVVFIAKEVDSGTIRRIDWEIEELVSTENAPKCFQAPTGGGFITEALGPEYNGKLGSKTIEVL